MKQGTRHVTRRAFLASMAALGAAVPFAGPSKATAAATPFSTAHTIVVLIARSKLVPDFALTIHFLHLLATTLYTRSLPRHAMWWATMLASSALAVAAGTWGCRYRELQPVFFGGGRILGSGGGGAAPSASGTADDDDDDGDVDVEAGEGGDGTPEDADAGFSRGRGRGRGRDGAGEYEMVQMQKAA